MATKKQNSSIADTLHFSEVKVPGECYTVTRCSAQNQLKNILKLFRRLVQHCLVALSVGQWDSVVLG